MKIHEIRYFLALCEERNFTRAARRCGVAQPSLTKAIKSLESKLGGALFYRSKSETRLTKLGKLVHPRMKRINQEAAHAQQIAQNYAGHMTNEASLLEWEGMEFAENYNDGAFICANSLERSRDGWEKG
jgi:DNA-binding transcriptional LysR family regulator